MPAPDIAAKDKLISLFETRMGDLADKYNKGEITIGDFQGDMRLELRQVHALQLIAASGVDKSLVGSDDWLKLGTVLKSQYRHLEKFSIAMQKGDLSAAQISARVKQYAGTSQVTFWKQATKDADLPTYPGQQECLGNCGCEWVDNKDGSYTWTRGKTDSCDDCINNAEIYNPYWPESSDEEDNTEE